MAIVNANGMMVRVLWLHKLLAQVNLLLRNIKEIFRYKLYFEMAVVRCPKFSQENNN